MSVPNTSDLRAAKARRHAEQQQARRDELHANLKNNGGESAWAQQNRARAEDDFNRINNRGEWGAFGQGSRGGSNGGDDGFSASGGAAIAAILAVLIAAGWAIATFGAFLTGPLAAFGAYKGLNWMTGKDKDDYEAVATGQSKSVGSIICLVLILSSGIVGARIGHQAAADFNSSDSNVEEVRDN